MTSGHALAAAFAAFTWWFSTGVILYLDGLPKRSFRFSMLGASLLAAAALVGLAHASGVATAGGATCAFVCAIVVWGWQEMSFLMGFVTGPRRTAATPGAQGWPRFREATQTVLYHELAIAASAVLVVALAWGQPNQVGTATFLVLWAMRLSAKLNLFFGVRNRGEEFLPEHLRYLCGYFRKRPINALLPLSLAASGAVAVLFAQHALAAAGGSFDGVGASLLATLVALAMIEHAFMVLPLPVAGLWRWGLRSHAASSGAAHRHP